MQTSTVMRSYSALYAAFVLDASFLASGRRHMLRLFSDDILPGPSVPRFFVDVSRRLEHTNLRRPIPTTWKFRIERMTVVADRSSPAIDTLLAITRARVVSDMVESSPSRLLDAAFTMPFQWELLGWAPFWVDIDFHTAASLLAEETIDSAPAARSAEALRTIAARIRRRHVPSDEVLEEGVDAVVREYQRMRFPADAMPARDRIRADCLSWITDRGKGLAAQIEGIPSCPPRAGELTVWLFLEGEEDSLVI